MKIVDDFFDFEVNNKLFDIIDEDGHRPWEAIRYYVCNRVINPHLINRNLYGGIPIYVRIYRFFVMMYSSIRYLLQHHNRKYMFILCSRDKQNGVYYDRISDALFLMADASKTFTIETVWHTSNYLYKGKVCPSSFFSLWFRLPHRRAHFDFRDLHVKLQKRFPDFTMSVNEMIQYYYEFKAQYWLYKFLFKYCGTKKVFFVQNGVFKGMMAAAQEMKVELFEFQHGQISYNHPAYSYPISSDVSEKKIYHPSKLLTFGPFWHYNRCYPGVENVVIGNDFYANNLDVSSTTCNKSILVISNMGEGELLASHVKEIIKEDKSFFFYFKLHPNQYEELEYYKTIFADFPNVQVISEDYSINHLLALVEAVFLVQSTVELEALRMGRKVFVLKEGAYQVMDFVFNEEGVYLVENAQEFIFCYQENQAVSIPSRNDLFVPFQSEVNNILF